MEKVKKQLKNSFQDENISFEIYSNEDFVGKRMVDTTFKQCDFHEIDFSNAKVINSVFNECEFNNTDFIDSLLKDTIFLNCFFNHCTYHGAQISNNHFTNCNILNNSFDHCIFDSGTIFDGGKILSSTFRKTIRRNKQTFKNILKQENNTFNFINKY